MPKTVLFSSDACLFVVVTSVAHNRRIQLPKLERTVVVVVVVVVVFVVVVVLVAVVLAPPGSEEQLSSTLRHSTQLKDLQAASFDIW